MYAVRSRDTWYHPGKGIVSIMSEFAVIAVSMKDALNDIAKQANALGAGLQNAAPGDRSGAPNNSVQYLFAIAEALEKIAEDCEASLTK